MDILCENCLNLAYDDEMQEYYCTINLDEDELAQFYSSSNKKCPYFRFGDDYTIVKKQK